MTADQSPKQPGKAQAAFTKTVRAVTQPAGKDIDWERVRAVSAIIGAITVLHGLKTRSCVTPIRPPRAWQLPPRR